MLEDMEKKIFQYIAECSGSGVPPTVREICSKFGIKSTSTVHKYLVLLENKGYILRGDRTNRSIRIAGRRTVNVPLIGTITAGSPILAFEEIDGYIPVESSGAGADDLFALRVHGDSMIDAAILDEDIVIARKTSTAANGDIVIALIGEEATVKRFFKENGHYRLQPENQSMDPIIVDDLQILGKVVSLVRPSI